MTTEQVHTTLLEAAQGGYSALRARITLLPAGGDGDKVAPPTHEGGKYAEEKRFLDGRADVPTVLLDSVQSQANRLEEVLLNRVRTGELRLPLLQMNIPNREQLTSLSVPHRVHDAIFRDSKLDGARFRDSAIGKEMAAARPWNATAMYRVCPTALLFGTWDSQSNAGVNAAKFARALVSEIVAIDAVVGQRTSSRIDPLGIKAAAGKVYVHKTEQWTLNENQAEQDKGKPKLYGKKGSPAEINHGNIPPGIKDGGVTMREARQVAVLSFVQLRKLRFPLNGQTRGEVDAAGRAVLAALGLYALTLQQEEGYQLRSRCHLIPAQPPQFEWLRTVATDAECATISTAAARGALASLVAHAATLGLTWIEEPIVLQPEPKLIALVEKSDASVEPEE